MFEKYYANHTTQNKQKSNDMQNGVDLFDKSFMQDEPTNINQQQGSGDFTLSIGQIAKLLSLPTHTIRFWNDEFFVNIPHVIGKGDRRYYNQKSLDVFTKIHKLIHKDGLKIKAIKDRQLLDVVDVKSVAMVSNKHNGSSTLRSAASAKAAIASNNKNTGDKPNDERWRHPSVQSLQNNERNVDQNFTNINGADTIHRTPSSDSQFYFTDVSSKNRKVQRLISDIKNDITKIVKLLD